MESTRMKLMVDDLDVLPSEDEIGFYREHGWYVSRLILPSELIEDATHDLNRHYAGERDHPLLAEHYVDWQPGREGLRLTDYMSLQHDGFRRLVNYPAIGAIASRLTGLPPIRLFHDQLIFKPPATPKSRGVVGWHTDRSYWRTCSSDAMLTAWIPFQDCDEHMGALSFLDGSHRWENPFWMKTFHEQDVARLEAAIEFDHPGFKRLAPTVQRGQVAFHNSRTVHGSPSNQSSIPRIALAIHLQDRTNSYVDAVDDQGTQVVHVIDTLCRLGPDGKPDYYDPDICPILCAT
jgi:Phytanoyl-CoA dioxygenase (PhyH)